MNADQVLVTVGAIEAMFLRPGHVRARRPGTRPTPCFPPARIVPEGLGAQLDTRWRCRFDDGYRLPLAAIAAALTPRTRLVSLASPQNPSGVRFTDAEIRR